VPLGNKEDDDGAELGGTRVLIASLLGLAAACWPDRSDRPDRPDGNVGAPWRVGRVDLLAPRGRLDEAPHAIRWSTTQRVVRVRVRVGNVAGAPIFERLTDEGHGSALELDDRERRLWSAARRCRIEIDAMAADGELVATGGPVEAWIDGAALPDPPDAAPDRR
jgi:hypothetical protein